MITKVNKLLEIANAVKADMFLQELEFVKKRVESGNTNIILPLVGEFSSGKTTLINSLTDSKVLETATKPTTATIYEIHFGNPEFKANYLKKDGKQIEIKEAAELKNDVLSDAIVVNVFDTSKKVPSSTVLVDTPGLSSTNPAHRQTLVDFLPYADAILLVSDINQQITKSLTEFVETMKLSHRPIYLVLTKNDTKAESEIEPVKKYIGENCKIPIENIACVSAVNDDVEGLLKLFEDIQLKKNEIAEKADKQRLNRIATSLQEYITQVIDSSASPTGFDDVIKEKEMALRKQQRAISKLIDDSKGEFENCGREASRRFEDKVFTDLSSLVAGKSANYDAEAVSLVNSTSSLMLSDLKSDITKVIRQKVDEYNSRNGDAEISLASLDMSGITVGPMSYTMNLNSAGHEYDGMISSGLKIAVAVGAVAAAGAALAGAATTSTAASTLASGAASEAAGSLLTDNVVDIADTATDVASIAYTARLSGQIAQQSRQMNQMTQMYQPYGMSFAQSANQRLGVINNYDQQLGQQMGSSKGLVETLVGFVTDSTMGKPQRKRAVHQYIDGTLLPQFKSAVEKVTNQTVQIISALVNEEMAQTLENQKATLASLKEGRANEKESFDKKIGQLRDYVNVLATI